ncbi:hypothetical protein [Kineosporia sp. NBRC 101731]|uniref:hypothetical protein n=1 Tax=Kineosporia sp. NBRC 101731 TaxID=3032199 RepID=UPI002553B058|nr:hypothetical protein [Kineosporia sp. NBRC 101731]
MGISPKSWQIDVKKGSVWVAVNCLGAGTVKVSVEPTAEFTIPCEESQVTPSLNEISLKKAKSWAVSFDPEPSVTWAARIWQ